MLSRLAAHSERLVESISQENFQRKMGDGVPVLLVFRDDSAASDAAIRASYKTAAQLKGSLNVVSVNGVRYQKLAWKLGVRSRSLPALVLVDLGNETQFLYPETTPIDQDQVCHMRMHALAHAAKQPSGMPHTRRHGQGKHACARAHTLSSLLESGNDAFALLLSSFPQAGCGHLIVIGALHAALRRFARGCCGRRVPGMGVRMVLFCPRAAGARSALPAGVMREGPCTGRWRAESKLPGGGGVAAVPGVDCQRP